MGSGLFLAKVLMFCSMNGDMCSIVEVESNPHKVSINLCIKNKSNSKFPIITIGAIDMNNQEDYAVYTIDRNCTKI